MNAQKQAFLEQKFGGRVSFNAIERKMYSHDIAAMPNLVKPLIGNTIPEAVVQPKTEAELAELVRWAYSQNIPLTPRGKASNRHSGSCSISPWSTMMSPPGWQSCTARLSAP